MLGLVTTVYFYRIGTYDQIEQLPLIMASMEEDYLPNDFFTEAGRQFGPRYYYVHLMAWSGRLLGLENALFGWTLLAQAGLAWVSFRMGKAWFEGDEVAALLSTAVVMSAEAVAWGSKSVIYAPYLTPGVLVMPLMGMSLLDGSRGRLMRAGLWAGLSAWVHILLGVETGLLVLGAGWWGCIRQAGRWHRPTWIQTTLGAGILIVMALPTLIPYAAQSRTLTAETFVQIIAVFRHPHHYLPSYFLANGWEWVKGAAFWGAMALAWWLWRKHYPGQALAQRFVALLTGLIAVGCVVGWWGVELAQNRLLTTAQTWRLLNLLKWIGLVLIGGSLGRMLRGKSPLGTFGGYLAMLTPLAMLAAMGKAAGVRLPVFGLALLGLLTAGLLLWIDQLYISSVGLVLIYALIMGLYLGGQERWGIGVVVALLVGTALNATLLVGRLPSPLESIAARVFRPRVYAWSYPDEMQAVMDFARTQTPTASVWLTPPDFGPMRIAGRRAIVVDFKAFPFQDATIWTWYQRILACYGSDPAARDEAWAQWNPASLRRIARSYEFDYAVVPHTDAWADYAGQFDTKTYKVLTRSEALVE